MRYRLHVSRAEYVAVMIPLLDGAMRLHRQHGHAVWKLSNWHALLSQTLLYLVFIAPVLLYLRHRYSYVELTHSDLEYRCLWRRRTMQYWQIERIVRGAKSLDRAGCGLTQIYANGMKRLDMKLEQTAEFIAEVKQYAPQALLEGTDE